MHVSVPSCQYANEFSLEIKLKIEGDSRTGEKNGKIHKLQLNSPTLMKRGEFSSSESPPSQPPPPHKERDHCAFDSQQIGRLVAHHTAITPAFIHLHMQAGTKNV